MSQIAISFRDASAAPIGPKMERKCALHSSYLRRRNRGYGFNALTVAVTGVDVPRVALGHLWSMSCSKARCSGS